MAEKGGTEPPLTLAVHNRHSPDHFSISSTLTLPTTQAIDRYATGHHHQPYDNFQ